MHIAFLQPWKSLVMATLHFEPLDAEFEEYSLNTRMAYVPYDWANVKKHFLDARLMQKLNL